MRKFESGATRNDLTEDKIAYNKLFNPAVVWVYGQYMKKHSMQEDGNRRSYDNWQKGIPVTVYLESLSRHAEDVQLHGEGNGDLATEAYSDALCGVLFNTIGLLFEHLISEEYIDRPSA